MGELSEIRKYGEFIKPSATVMWGVCLQGRGLMQRRKIEHEVWEVGRVQTYNELIRVCGRDGGTQRFEKGNQLYTVRSAT